MYGDDSSELDIDDILNPIIEEFSIKADITLKKVAEPATHGRGPIKMNKKGANQQPAQKQDFSASNYSNLKNNYLGRISSPQPTAGSDETERKSIRDEQTPEQLFERKMSIE